VARAGDAEEVEGLDEEFLYHLNRGSDLLARGEAEPARAALERALELRPRDVKVLGLLGQAYYRLSRFEDAARAWQRLVHESPVEPGARVNLGLALLKAKRHAEAVKQLEVVLDLAPEHRKAMGYLGLALLESGDPGAALPWFRKAGSEAMVARCEAVLAGGAPEPEEAGAEDPEAAEGPPAPEPLLTPPPGGLAAVSTTPTQTPTAAIEPLSSFAAARLVSASSAPFALERGVLSVAVRGEVRVRLDGLLALRGEIALQPERKRFRGRATESAFGEGATRMHRAAGDGTLLFRATGRRLTPLDLAGETAYLREEVVFAFEGALAFENGRVPSQAPAELNLVHLRGRGAVVLVTLGEPVALDVASGAPLRVPLGALVGWSGSLTPRLGPLADEGDGAPVAVELAGEGRVLVDPGAPAPGSAP
jgi:Flp pilus assembly protein TadD/uncharacterized protein (AIM24 family)